MSYYKKFFPSPKGGLCILLGSPILMVRCKWFMFPATTDFSPYCYIHPPPPLLHLGLLLFRHLPSATSAIMAAWLFTGDIRFSMVRGTYRILLSSQRELWQSISGGAPRLDWYLTVPPAGGQRKGRHAASWAPVELFTQVWFNTLRVVASVLLSQ